MNKQLMGRIVQGVGPVVLVYVDRGIVYVGAMNPDGFVHISELENARFANVDDNTERTRDSDPYSGPY